LYVNVCSIDPGAEGRRAVELLFERAASTESFHPRQTTCFYSGSRSLVVEPVEPPAQMLLTLV
jgi:hypothetical protein